MISGTVLLIHLCVSITLILVVIIGLKWNPMIGLIFGSLYMGIASHLGLQATILHITQGFGDIMAGIGLSIGFGVIMGQLLSDSGGARSIALAMIQKCSQKYVLYGIGLTAFVLSIPVFYDVTFVILIPLALALVKEIEKPLPYAIGAMVIGAATAHTLVPPTPNPLAAASILGFDLGIMILTGLSLGVFAAIFAMKSLFFLLDRGFWKRKQDEMDTVPGDETKEIRKSAPSASLALVPIFLPVCLILLGTTSRALLTSVPPFIEFISDKVLAMFLGTIAAYLITSPYLKQDTREKTVQKAMSSAGIVLLITGAGGSFGAVIKATGIGDILVKGIGHSVHSAVYAVLLTYFLGMIFRVSQGSGTVASITAMTIMAGANLAQTAQIHPVYIALASLAGGISIGHINDSGFWVTAKLGGVTVTGGLKVYTLSIFFISLFVLGATLIGVIVLPY